MLIKWGNIMNIVIIGNGNIGKALTKKLSEKDHNIVVIDNDYNKIQKIINNYDVRAIFGNGAVYENQIRADVGKSDLLISVTSSDEVNLVSSIIAKSLGCCNTIARVSNIDYSYQSKFMREHFNLNLIINPEKLVAEEIMKIIRYPSWLKIQHLKKLEVSLLNIELEYNNKLINYHIDEINKVFKTNVKICILDKNNDIIIPPLDYMLKENDKIIVIGLDKDIKNFLHNIRVLESDIKSVMIVGHRKEGIYLANSLTNLGIKVKILEKDINKCKEITYLAPKARVINEDGTSQEILLEEGINNTDVFISMTDLDEKNIITSMYVSNLNVPKVITLVNNISIKNLLNFSNLNNFISPKDIISKEIVEYVDKDNVDFKEFLSNSLHNKIKVSEINISKKDNIVGRTLKKLYNKPEVLILAIIRNDSIIIPTEDEYIKINDKIVFLTTNNRNLRKFDSLFF